MADYRRSCATPDCSYTGFSGHSPWCQHNPNNIGTSAVRSKQEWLESKYTYLLTAGGIKFYECNNCLAVVRDKSLNDHRVMSHSSGLYA
jgi:hypothetical protein